MKCDRSPHGVGLRRAAISLMAAGVFGTYRLISAAATPMVRRHLRRRVARGREDAAAWPSVSAIPVLCARRDR
jgi:hypothetical protein